MEPLLPGDPERVGPYRLVGRLGAGGMGQVFLARSPGGRPVVVKVILPEYASDAEYRARFAREVEAARRVGGFHTAQVVAAAPDADPPWMAAAYVPGPSLSQAVHQRGPLDEHALRVLAAGLAEGLAAIHECGLVHRDFKPGNIILAADGPRIIDFGIARPTDASTMTQTGAVIGTLSYMSPEQIGGGLVGPASDIFSFGTVLAFAATGRSPFAAESLGEVVMRIVGEPPDLAGLPDDLRELIHACWERNPDRRPATAELLARLSTDQTGDDWPPSHLADLIDSAPLGSTTSPQRPLTGAEPPRPHAPPAPPQAPPTPPHQPPAPGGGRNHTPPSPGQGAPPPGQPFPGPTQPSPWEQLSPAQKGLLGGAVTAAVVGLAASLAIWFWASSADFSPSGGSSPQASSNGGNSPQNAVEPPGPRVLDRHSDWVRSVAFSPDGAVLASAGDDGTVRLWDVASGEEQAVWDGDAGFALSVVFSADGSRLASSHEDGTVHLWDVEDEEEQAVLDGHSDWVRSVAFSPDGSLLASAGDDGTVRLWDVEDEEEQAVLDGHSDWVRSVAFSPDGSLLASGGDDGTIHLWPIGTE